MMNIELFLYDLIIITIKKQEISFLYLKFLKLGKWNIIAAISFVAKAI